jgi:hypothetical protein
LVGIRYMFFQMQHQEGLGLCMKVNEIIGLLISEWKMLS